MIQGVEGGGEANATFLKKIFGGKLDRCLKHGRYTDTTIGALDTFRAYLRIGYETSGQVATPPYTSAFVVSSNKTRIFCDRGAQIVAEDERCGRLGIRSEVVYHSHGSGSRTGEGGFRGWFGARAEIRVELAS